MKIDLKPVRLSDYIVKITPTELLHENLYVKTVKVTVNKHYKGNLQLQSEILALPGYIKLDEEYIVFLKKGDEMPSITARNGSVVKTNSPQGKYVIEKYRGK
ncbi:hypothetical protein [Fredinandcohnia quinoae]|uniref:Uncharacterized protein n=1 Tax=Fredinandcohnia quinoae TaxID=2918902 RepID=A0AAW5E828_9BACI|nr:hypothetical protein [Fredinandcohnia sp. SECRCQ15]MCH1626172.1 hypothetical protein [Fredinandcohnia sp. SECRCQ15]